MCSGIINQSLWFVYIEHFVHSLGGVAFVKGNKVLVKEALMNELHSPRKWAREAAQRFSMSQMTHRIQIIWVCYKFTSTNFATCISQGQRSMLHILLYCLTRRLLRRAVNSQNGVQWWSHFPSGGVTFCIPWLRVDGTILSSVCFMLYKKMCLDIFCWTHCSPCAVAC
jgi:hypothetical protein